MAIKSLSLGQAKLAYLVKFADDFNQMVTLTINSAQARNEVGI